jgi:hypothetical protein
MISKVIAFFKKMMYTDCTGDCNQGRECVCKNVVTRFNP